MPDHVADGDADGAEALPSDADDAIDVGRIGHVGGDRFDVARCDRVDGRRSVVEMRLRAGGDDNAHTLADEHLGDAATDAAAATRDDGDLALDPVVHQNTADPTPPSTVSVTPGEVAGPL